MQVFLGLGANMGNRYENLVSGCEMLSKRSEIQLINTSPIYETPPLYNVDQSSYLNMVVEITTQYSANELIIIIKDIEAALGRNIQDGHNLPRVLDIDILSYGSEEISEEELTIPHPRIFERKFVLQPWSDIADDFILVGMNESIKSLLQNTPDTSEIKLTQHAMELIT